MTLNQAFSIRVIQILKNKKMTKYRLEQETGLYHSTLSCLLNGRYKTANFRTMALIIKALGLSITEFFDDPIFDFDNIEID